MSLYSELARLLPELRFPGGHTNTPIFTQDVATRLLSAAEGPRGRSWGLRRPLLCRKGGAEPAGWGRGGCSSGLPRQVRGHNVGRNGTLFSSKVVEDRQKSSKARNGKEEINPAHG